MITSVCFLLFAVTVPLLGGRLSRLGEIRLRAWWTIIAALVIQVFLLEILAGTLDGMVAAVIHLLSYGLSIVFVWHNRHVTGMALMVLGGLLNLAAIGANGGVMPAERSALERAGIITDSPEFENSAVIEDARLWFLGDVFAIPEGVPFANVFSIGDIILVLGGGITVHVVGRSRLAPVLARLDPVGWTDRGFGPRPDPRPDPEAGSESEAGEAGSESARAVEVEVDAVDRPDGSADGPPVSASPGRRRP